jgi:hypothetical protein
MNTNKAVAVSLEISSRKVANVVTDVPSGRSSLVVSQASNQAMVYMQTTDTAKVVVYDHDTGPISGNGYSTFSGVLLSKE